MATTSRQVSASHLLGCPTPLDTRMTLDREHSHPYTLDIHTRPINKTELNITEGETNESGVDLYQLEHAINAGYTSDDESSESEEPQDSGRTRSSTRRANQVTEKQTAQPRATRGSDKTQTEGEGKGQKRKKAGTGGDGSDSETEGSKEKRRPCVEVVNETEELVCSCPKDVMTCIGILPSHPIISYFHESDDSDSSCNDDLTHTVLPTVPRNRREGGGGEGC